VTMGSSSVRVAALLLLSAETALASFAAGAQPLSAVGRARAAPPRLEVASTFQPLLGKTAAELSAAPNPPATAEHDILLRAARGETVERTPVWLMRQAGRYQPAFREYSTTIEFRKRSETPEIATELSLQPWRAFGVDGVIMFSDILTPLPALGVEFDVVRGSGPVIPAPLRTAADVAALTPLDDPESKLPFIREILGNLRKETEGRSTLLGFVGAPFTLVAYSVEGSANRHCIATKKMMTQAPEVLHAALVHYAEAIGQYACYQIECGAQSVQFFESWAHHLGAGQFAEFARPYANMAMSYVKRKHPDVPIVYYANGGSPYLDLQKEMDADIISLDWSIDMARGREILGADRLVQGNVDPTILFGDDATITGTVHANIRDAGGPGKHLLNLGHGVLQGTPESAVLAFVEAAKSAK